MFMQTDKHFYECLTTCQSEKKHIWNWSKILFIFHFFINLFMKTLIRSIIYCQAVLLNHLLTVCMLRKLYISLLCLVLNFSKSVTVLFRSIPNGNCLFSSASLLREITHWCMGSDSSCSAACKCNLLCPTSSFKLVYPKSQSVIGSNLKVIFVLQNSV